jgi:hypothetical protein
MVHDVTKRCKERLHYKAARRSKELINATKEERQQVTDWHTRYADKERRSRQSNELPVQSKWVPKVQKTPGRSRGVEICSSSADLGEQEMREERAVLT